jgi:hypothetical protein
MLSPHLQTIIHYTQNRIKTSDAHTAAGLLITALIGFGARPTNLSCYNNRNTPF